MKRRLLLKTASGGAIAGATAEIAAAIASAPTWFYIVIGGAIGLTWTGAFDVLFPEGGRDR